MSHQKRKPLGRKLHLLLCELHLWPFLLDVAAWKEAGLLERDAFLRPDALNDTNHLQIFVYCNEEKRTCVLSARLDNLGKGASGAAVQNLNIALGLDETTGL